jgi:hypothetical protein
MRYLNQQASEIDKMDYGEVVVLDNILYEHIKEEIKAGR